MTKRQIEQAAEKYSAKYSDDPHSIADESFIAGAIWVIENTKPSCIKICGNTEPHNGICLNCGSSLIDIRINDPKR